MKHIPNTDKKYVAYPDGTIYNTATGKCLTGAINKDGYLQTTLRINGKKTTVLWHRVILSTFTPQDKPCPVNHIDGNKLNNKILNLEWSSPLHNIQHAIKTGLKRVHLSKNPNYKSPIQHTTKDGIFGYVTHGPNQFKLLGFTASGVYSCANNKLKTHKGFTHDRL